MNPVKAHQLAVARHPNARRRSPGVILQGRLPVTQGMWDDEIDQDGGKAKVHCAVRHAEDRTWRREAAADIADAREDGLLAAR